MFDLYFKNSFVSIYYNKALRLGKAVWNGHLSGFEFREAILLCMDLVDRHELIGWLGDDRMLGAIEPADLKWSLEVHLPQLAASSMLRMASLPSVQGKNKEVIETMVEKNNELGQKLIFREFEREEEAVAWLLELHAELPSAAQSPAAAKKA
jgi:hypothetical protein